MLILCLDQLTFIFFLSQNITWWQEKRKKKKLCIQNSDIEVRVVVAKGTAVTQKQKKLPQVRLKSWCELSILLVMIVVMVSRWDRSCFPIKLEYHIIIHKQTLLIGENIDYDYVKQTYPYSFFWKEWFYTMKCHIFILKSRHRTHVTPKRYSHWSPS